MAIDSPLLPNEHVVFIPSGDSEGDLKAREARMNVQKKRTELAERVLAIIEDTITAIIEDASGTELDDEDKCSGSQVIDRYLARDPAVLQQALREGCFEQRGYTVFFFEVVDEAS
jgi:sulfur relay (sulfurtransferase) DsrF/TusC family protein